MASPYMQTDERNFGVNYSGLGSQFPGGPHYAIASETVDGEAERADMARLQRKMANHPEKKDKYIDLINKKYNELMQNREEKIKTNHIKYNDYDKPELKNVYRLMYNRNCALKGYDATPFSDTDARWYQVKLGKQPIFLRLEGTGKFVLITGLINPQLNLAVKNN